MFEPASLLEDVRSQIAGAAKIALRNPADVTLVAVSKTQTAEAIRPLIAAGQRVFGENRVQETAEKWPAILAEHPDITLHLIGQLQSNKADEAVALFDCIQSLDRPSLVTALARAMDKTGRRVPCFVQVNIGEEAQKGGCALADLPGLIASARAADIPLAGLMCLPPLKRDDKKWEPVFVDKSCGNKESRTEYHSVLEVEPAPYFALLAKLAHDNGLTGLSMGMSGDFATAVMLGASHVRIGTALFGAR